MPVISSHLYLIALIPPASIRKEIRLLKEEVRSKFGARQALKLPAHITLQKPFWVENKKQETLKKQLRGFAMHQSAFKVHLNGFGSFPPRVIYVKISNPETILDFHVHFQLALAAHLFLNPSERQLKIHPHLTIATRDLQENIFPQAWATFQNRDYTTSFTANEFILFRHDGKKWSEEEVFHFKDFSKD